jgi:hypothetical protein
MDTTWNYDKAMPTPNDLPTRAVADGWIVEESWKPSNWHQWNNQAANPDKLLGWYYGEKNPTDWTDDVSKVEIVHNIDKSGKHTVITNGLLAAKKFAEAGALVYSTGGRLLTESYAFVGHTSEESLDKYNADIMFFSAASLSDKGMISDWSEEECNMRVAMSRHAKVKVFMCDSTKFSSTSAFKLFSLSKVDYVVCDSPLSDKILTSFSLNLVADDPAYLYKIEKKISKM